MHLGLFIHGVGHHIAAWRAASAPGKSLSFGFQADIARRAEAACFDLLFTADSNATFGPDDPAVWAQTGAAARFEPITLLSALAAVTERIGLVCTATTTYSQPFRVARQFASLDLLSDGRAGWNVVTSSAEAEALNFSHGAHPPHAERYDRAAEFIDVVRKLWSSWDDGHPAPDPASGQFHDPAHLHFSNHDGRHYKVRGPLTTPRSPQGQPVIVQAGQSEDGRKLAARTADVVFTVQQEIGAAQAFRADMRARAAQAGRDPDEIKVMPGLMPVLGRTREGAEGRLQQLQALIPTEVAVKTLSDLVNMDLSRFPLDGPLPEVPVTNTQQGRQKIVVALARTENLSIRQLGQRVVGARGHMTLCGTPADIAEVMIRWVEEGAADGFNVMPLTLPDGLTEFCDQVIPHLQAREMFRCSYEGTTLRHHLGLKQPSA